MLMMITSTCRMCRKEAKIKVAVEDFEEWKEGKLIQEAFPYLAVSEREQLISNICGPCFDKMFEDE